MPMDWGEDRNDKNERLIHAAMVGDLATVKLLFRDPEIDASWVHHVVFLRACAKGRVELVRLLLSSNLPTGVLNATGKHSNPFLEACVHNRTEVVELLLSDPRINPNIKDHQGRSALFFAVYKGNEDMIKQLISSPEYLMSTPDELDELRDIAAMEDHEDCLYLLEEYYADREATVKKYRKELEYGKGIYSSCC
jgi:ankyrin repeat protein